LFETSPTFNLGGSPEVIAGSTASGFRSRALIRFDVGSVPANATVLAARLTITVTKIPIGAEDSMFNLRRALQSWGEGNKSGTGNGAPATAGEASWVARFHPSTLWAAGGGLAGTDFSETVSGSQVISGTGSYQFPSTLELVADVQFWLTNAASNFGWFLVTLSEDVASTARRIASRETPLQAPRLEIEYTLTPRPRIEQVSAMGNEFRFQFTGQAGKSYTVECKSALTNGTWETFTNFPSQTMTAPITVTTPISGPHRFYRVGEF
jgi:hypothetical protein